MRYKLLTILMQYLPVTNIINLGSGGKPSPSCFRVHRSEVPAVWWRNGNLSMIQVYV